MCCGNFTDLTLQDIWPLNHHWANLHDDNDFFTLLSQRAPFTINATKWSFSYFYRLENSGCACRMSKRTLQMFENALSYKSGNFTPLKVTWHGGAFIGIHVAKPCFLFQRNRGCVPVTGIYSFFLRIWNSCQLKMMHKAPSYNVPFNPETCGMKHDAAGTPLPCDFKREYLTRFEV